ncbi:tetratricopeptide repeat protein [Hymenobacter ruricola]|uniref:Tetratricopeptide repeat protein n=1 Tax=Hymenobacter ruricola TaxID=2791023 RepID=A0ABS0IAM7_9BACT|nr:hypothetical protein [Hymenobacter ruricola]MBF9224034.1 hypothetical protein [Hymenobacter ruricola]
MQKLPSLFSGLMLLMCVGATPPCLSGINLLPMYGRVKKCPEQLEADKRFLADCARRHKSPQEAASAYAALGWKYFYNNQLDVAMRRFNQAWLLDSMNQQVPWGFANILGRQGQFIESLPFFRVAIARNPTEANVWESASVSYGNVYLATKNTAALDSSVQCLKQAIKFNPKEARLYATLTGAYSYYPQKDSARKYLALADKLDPQAVDKKVRKQLTKAK